MKLKKNIRKSGHNKKIAVKNVGLKKKSEKALKQWKYILKIIKFLKIDRTFVKILKISIKIKNLRGKIIRFVKFVWKSFIKSLKKWLQNCQTPKN